MKPTEFTADLRVIMEPIFRRELAEPVALSSGRVILHTHEPNGCQRATPSTGDYAMTSAEYNEYCATIAIRHAERCPRS